MKNWCFSCPTFNPNQAAHVCDVTQAINECWKSLPDCSQMFMFCVLLNINQHHWNRPSRTWHFHFINENTMSSVSDTHGHDKKINLNVSEMWSVSYITSQRRSKTMTPSHVINTFITSTLMTTSNGLLFLVVVKPTPVPTLPPTPTPPPTIPPAWAGECLTSQLLRLNWNDPPCSKYGSELSGTPWWNVFFKDELIASTWLTSGRLHSSWWS